MYSNVMGLLLADDREVSLSEISEPRALSAVPFAGRFRIIDFLLSNMVNSNIKTVGVVALNRYRSLMDHIGTGRWWDLDRMNQGLTILPPYINPETRIAERSEAMSIIEYMKHYSREYVVISGSNFVMNYSYEDLIRQHKESGADITVMYNNDGNKFGKPYTYVHVEKGGRVTDVLHNPENLPDNTVAIGLCVINCQVLREILQEAMARGIDEFSIKKLLSLYKCYKIYAYKYDGLVFRINSVSDYFKASMKLLEPNVLRSLFNDENMVYTKSKNRAPCFASVTSKVTNSLTSDGCILHGTVDSSLIARNCLVQKGAVVKNCVIFQDVVIGSGAYLKNLIIDKGAVIRQDVELSGHADYPLVISKGTVL